MDKQLRIKKMIELNAEKLFLCGMVCTLFSDIMIAQNIETAWMWKGPFVLGMVLLLFKFLIDLLRKEYALCSLFFVAMLTYILTHNGYFLELIIVIVAAKDVDYEKIAKVYAIEIMALFIINIVLLIAGIREFTYLNEEILGHARINRLRLGYSHPNVAMSMYISVICSLIIWLRDNIKSWAYIGFFSVGCVIFYFTDSRFGILVMCVILFLGLARNTGFRNLVLRHRLTEVTFGLSFIIMMIMGIVFNGEYLIHGGIYNTLISRFVAWGWGVKNVGLSMFGKPYNNYFPIDCGYYRAIFVYGVIGAIVLFYFYIRSMKCKYNDYFFSIAMMALIVTNIFEPRIMSVFFSLPVIAAMAKHNT